ncbi:hypothetical protein M422DRAFT_52135 [Sphaerobolus stellatus SS14]|uniref:Unplaced genomic scaffold SPHSTscaffold_128, whole genome shotgun sequence n=1 Tax=Sphaerobolus stellatus (strain SS14) TaxID=990650 RepID=A0A0C9TUW3_SPHS4|nr:hypothetical protein M422DRAFT_52135 [Sphaerobolus stellatus SS14]
MSSNSTLPPGGDPAFLAFVQSISDLQSTRYVGFAALGETFLSKPVPQRLIDPQAVLLYDSILAFPAEVKVIWTRQIRLGGILYILGRYSNIISLTLGVVFFIEALNPSLKCAKCLSYLCSALNTSIAVFALAGSLGTRGLLLGRAYAVCLEMRWLKLGVVTLFAFAVGVLAAHIHFAPCNAPDNGVITMLQKYEYPPVERSCIYQMLIHLETLNAISVVLFEAAVVAITVHHAWRERDLLSRVLRRSKAQSLSILFVRQGIVRFIIIFAWTLEASIVQKLVRPGVSGIDSSVESAISTILICRFTLQLLEANAHPNGTTSEGQETNIGSFHAAIRAFDDTIMADFADNGQLLLTEINKESVQTSDSEGPITLPGEAATAGLTLEEYPWLNVSV